MTAKVSDMQAGEKEAEKVKEELKKAADGLKKAEAELKQAEEQEARGAEERVRCSLRGEVRRKKAQLQLREKTKIKRNRTQFQDACVSEFCACLISCRPVLCHVRY